MKPLEKVLQDSWKQALAVWNNPSLPEPIYVITNEEIEELAKFHHIIKSAFAFMNIPSYQTFVNVKKLRDVFSDFESSLRATLKHEIGHSFCPGNEITSALLVSEACTAIENSYDDIKTFLAGGISTQYFADACVNTHLLRKCDEDVVMNKRNYAFMNLDCAFRKVHVKGLEHASGFYLLPGNTSFSEEERSAAKRIAVLLDRDVMEGGWWVDGVKEYAITLAPFVVK